MTSTGTTQLWQFYLQLSEVEAAFRDIKGDLSIRPIFHQREQRIEAHIFLSFLAYCVHVTFKHQLKTHAPGLTVRRVRKIRRDTDARRPFPTDGRELIFTRYTEPVTISRCCSPNSAGRCHPRRHRASRLQK